MAKQRLDALLVARGLCPSRQRAQRLIRAGDVTVDRHTIDKPGTEVAINAQIQIAKPLPYVSRGGEKLAKALQSFAIVVCDRICLDGGISTGGFTDCLLQAGARLVYGVDVGYGQVAWKLRQDPRTILHERTNLRHLKPQELYDNSDISGPDGAWADLGVVDVSFISLTKILPALWPLLQPPREVILLIKPQFEVGRDYFQKPAQRQSRSSKKGVVRDPEAQIAVIQQVLQAAQSLGWQYRGLTWSPLTGPAGNIEYLLWLDTNSPASQIEQSSIAQVVGEAWRTLSS